VASPRMCSQISGVIVGTYEVQTAKLALQRQ